MSYSHFDKVWNSYTHLGRTAYQAATTTSPTDAHLNLRWFILDMPIIPLLLACHCLFAAVIVYRLTNGNQFWLKSLVLTACAAFGGSTLSSVLSALPAPLFTHSSNVMMSHILLAWYVVNHILPLRILLVSRPISAILAFVATTAKARTIFAFMDTFVSRFPNQPAGAIVLAGLAGSAGSLFLSMEKIVQRGFIVSSELSAPGWGFKSAYLASALYYIMTDPDSLLQDSLLMRPADRDTARFCIAAALCFHAALETLYGRHFNPLFWPERVFYALTGVRKDFDPSPVFATPHAEPVPEMAGEAQYSAQKENGVRRRRRKPRTAYVD